MNVPPPGRPKGRPFNTGRGKADEQPSPHSPGKGPGERPFLLVGDIGGTKTLLGLSRDGKQFADRRYANADFQGFGEVLAAFLADTQADPTTISGGCLAVAGPVADEGCSARLTNLPWDIVVEELSQRFGLPALRLANDFAAAALGAVTAPAAQLAGLQAGEPDAAAPRLVVGAGTGLGMAIVLPQGDSWRVIAGEGGHVAFAPADEQQAALWAFLRQRHGRVTWERVVSGPGLAAIHEFLDGERETPEAIAMRALADATSTARRSLDLFLATYGAFAGDMALACLARGGVYLAGGIAAKLLPVIAASPFIATFNAKAEHAGIAARMPVSIATDGLLGLHGAAFIASETRSRPC